MYNFCNKEKGVNIGWIDHGQYRQEEELIKRVRDEKKKKEQ